MAAADPIYKKCGNGLEWFGYHMDTSVDGIIRTFLYGCGEAILDYGNCNEQGTVAIYLDHFLIGSTYHTPSKLISFSYTNGSILEIKEIEQGIIKFNNFTVIECYLCEE